MNKDDLQELANLSRLELNDSEIEKMPDEINSILKYIDQIKDATEDSDDLKIENSNIRNIMREDENPHEAGKYTESIIKESPESENGYIKVKKILK